MEIGTNRRWLELVSSVLVVPAEFAAEADDDRISFLMEWLNLLKYFTRGGAKMSCYLENQYAMKFGNFLSLKPALLNLT